MNRKEFLTKLNSGLSDLSERERREIVKFYYDRISSGIKSGKTEEDAIGELDSINKIVGNILNEYNTKNLNIETNLSSKNSKYIEELADQEQTEQKIDTHVKGDDDQQTDIIFVENVKSTNLVARLFGLLGLLFFDILITSWLIPVAIILIISALVLSLVLFVLPFTALVTTYNVEVKAGIIIGTIGLAILSTTLIKFAIRILKFIVQIILNLHYNVISGRPNKKFKFNYEFKLKGSKYKLFIILSILAICTSAVMLILNSDNLIDNYIVKPDYMNKEFSEEIDLSETWDLTVDSPSSKLEIEFYDESEIKFIYDYFEGEEVEIVVDKETNTISCLYEYTWVSQIDINVYQQKDNTNITIYVPKGMMIHDLSINVSSGIQVEYDTLKVVGEINLLSYNGDIVLSNIEAKNVSIHSYNGDVIMSNVIADNVSLVVYNGSVSAIDIVSNDLFFKNYNGNVKLENATAISDETSKIRVVSYNGDIIMSEVYIASVDIETYNGDIIYENSNKDYEIAFVDEPKSHNGKEYIDI